VAEKDSVDSLVSLEKLKELIPDIPDPNSQSESFVRAIHRGWKSSGGYVSGKPRHSDRFLTDKLKESGAEVRSLTPKLVGKTRISAKDAETLLRFFLQNWPEGEEGEDGEVLSVLYAPLLSKTQIDEIVALVSDGIVTGAIPILSAEPLTAEQPATQIAYLPGEAAGKLIQRMFQECDAYFIVGTERPLVTQQPRTELWGFRNIINQLKEIEETENRPRPIIWVLDMGRQKFEEEDVEARQRYLGVQALLTRFKALQHFEDRGREERWAWLNKHAAIMVFDIRLEPGDMRGIRRPTFAAHHVSFTAVAPLWAMNSNFRALYGSDLERLDQRNFSVFYRAAGWPAFTEAGEETRVHRRYFGYASFAREVGRGMELPSPGANYEDAYRTAYAAAVDMLGLENKSAETFVDPKHAAAQLRYLGYRLLPLSEFMKL
jgi:hypothetical protein